MQYLETNKDLTNFSSFRTRSFSKYFFEIKNLEDIDKLKEIISFARGNNLRYEFIGAGTNILFAFEEFDGIMIKNSLKSQDLILKGNILEVFSGDIVILKTRQLLDKEITRFAPFLGLPGTFGGALVGNAGCFGLEIKDIFISASVLDLDTLEIIEINKDFMNFEYRNSRLKNNPKYFVISMKLDISGQNNLSDIEESIKKRKETQPRGVATCGSFFKNPVGDSAGRLIEAVGLKGKILNGAKISEKHANFFINFDNANYMDILNLRDLAKEKVKAEFGIELEEEVKIIGQ
ncbi:MAG: UDP-N-acetylmuramate dehydrogenase [Candidatus Gracilibacteria bacterium]|nr:UDP-N-acetylmuramate dehydrogenase [Candidatus Gracilibacteria bacterium]